jgi:hypothetical protein
MTKPTAAAVQSSIMAELSEHEEWGKMPASLSDYVRNIVQTINSCPKAAVPQLAVLLIQEVRRGRVRVRVGIRVLSDACCALAGLAIAYYA